MLAKFCFPSRFPGVLLGAAFAAGQFPQHTEFNRRDNLAVATIADADPAATFPETIARELVFADREFADLFALKAARLRGPPGSVLDAAAIGLAPQVGRLLGRKEPCTNSALVQRPMAVAPGPLVVEVGMERRVVVLTHVADEHRSAGDVVFGQVLGVVENKPAGGKRKPAVNAFRQRRVVEFPSVPALVAADGVAAHAVDVFEFAALADGMGPVTVQGRQVRLCLSHNGLDK